MQLEEIKSLISEKYFELKVQITSKNGVLINPMQLTVICNLGFLHLFDSIYL